MLVIQIIDVQYPWSPKFVKNDKLTRLKNKDSKKTLSFYGFSTNLRAQLGYLLS